MWLETICKKCKNNIRFKDKSPDRYKFYLKRGKEIELECMNCIHKQKYDVNRIKAIQNPRTTIILITLSILLTPLITLFTYQYLDKTTNPYSTISLLLPASIPFTVFIIWKSEQNRICNFWNAFKIN